VLVLWAWTGLLSSFVLIPVYTGKGTSFVPLGVVALALFLYTIFGPGMMARRNGDHEGSSTRPEAEATSSPSGEGRVASGWR
jgi:UDP-GlcNAc:undecaprenyl-phosphate GlcNAc-1-phosphate transferase